MDCPCFEFGSCHYQFHGGVSGKKKKFKMNSKKYAARWEFKDVQAGLALSCNGAKTFLYLPQCSTQNDE